MPKYEITSPDGTKYEVTAPDGATEEQVMQYAQSQFSKKPKNKFANIVSTTLQKAVATKGEIDKLESMRQSGEITGFESEYRKLGQQMAGVGELASGAVEMADTALLNVPSAALKAVGGAVGSIRPPGAEKNIGETAKAALLGAAKGYSGLEEKFPRTMGIVGATGNIASVLPLGIASPSKKIGQEIAKSGVKKSDDALIKTLQPIQTSKVREEAQKAGRLVTGIEDKINPTNLEKLALDVIKRDKVIPETFKPSLPKIESATRNHARKISQDISADLGQFNKIKLKQGPLKNTILNNVVKELNDDPTLWTATGNPKQTVNNYVSKLESIINSNPPTLQGLMQSRIQFDEWAKSKKPSVFNGAVDDQITAATRATRNAVNNYLESAAAQLQIPDTVLGRLKESHALFSAADNVATKVSKQSNTVIGRAVSALENSVPFKSDLAKLGFISGIGAAGYTLPQITATAAGLYLGGKLLNSSQSRKLIGTVIKNSADVLDVSAKESLLDYSNMLLQQDDEDLKRPAKEVINK